MIQRSMDPLERIVMLDRKRVLDRILPILFKLRSIVGDDAEGHALVSEIQEILLMNQGGK